MPPAARGEAAEAAAAAAGEEVAVVAGIAVEAEVALPRPPRPGAVPPPTVAGAAEDEALRRREESRVPRLAAQLPRALVKRPRRPPPSGPWSTSRPSTFPTAVRTAAKERRKIF